VRDALVAQVVGSSGSVVLVSGDPQVVERVAEVVLERGDELEVLDDMTGIKDLGRRSGSQSRT